MIRKLVIVLIVLGLTGSSALAGTGVGVTLGMGSFTLRGVNGNNVEANRVLRGSLGFFATLQLMQLLNLHFQIFYVQMGTKKVFNYTTPTTKLGAGGMASINASEEMTEDISLGYIKIPLLARYEVPVPGKLKPRLLLGPTIGINVSGKDKASGQGEWDGEHDIGNLKKIDISGIVGAGVSYPVGNLEVGVDLIYDHSFSSAFEDVTDEELANDTDFELWTETDTNTGARTTKAVDFKNSGFSVMFNVALPLGLVK